MIELDKEFFNRDTLVVAEELVGKILCVDGICGRILEVEAYKEDGASHARKRTKRSALMFDSYGKVYVYLIYGMYHCLNFTSDINPGAVLIRSIDIDGCDGPGKLCRTLNITRDDNGVDVGKRIKVLDDGYIPLIKRTGRIGILNDNHLDWRFLEVKQ